MALDLIAQMHSSEDFVHLCDLVLAEEYEDYAAVNDSGGDRGDDGYSLNSATLFQMHCPEDVNKNNDRAQKRKILADLIKAKKLVDEENYKIKRWVFLTPRKLRQPVLVYLRSEARKRNMRGVSWASPKLNALLAKYSYLNSQLPYLNLPDVAGQIAEVGLEVSKVMGRLDSVDEMKARVLSEKERNYHKRIDHAKEAQNNRKHETARAEYLLILDDLNDESEAVDRHIRFRLLNNLGLIELDFGREAAAAKLFREAYAAEPDLPLSRCHLALALVMEGSSEQGMDTVEAVLAEHPDEEEALKLKAQILVIQGRGEEGAKFLRDKGKVGFSNWILAQALLAQGRQDEAVESLEAFVRFEPKSYRGFIQLSNALLADVMPALRNNPVPPNRIESKLAAKIDKATAALREAIRLLKETENKLELAAAYANLSACLGAKGLPQEAIEVAREATKLDPQEPLAHRNEAAAYLQLNNFAEAARSLRRYKELGGDEPLMDVLLVRCEIELGQIDLAERVIEAHLAKVTPPALHMIELAVDVYERKLARAKLSALMERLELEFPNNSHALRIRARYLAKRRLPGARELLKRAIRVAPSQADLMVSEIMLGQMLQEAEDFSGAAEIYKRHLSSDEDNPALTRYGQCLYNLGKFGELLEWLNSWPEQVRQRAAVLELQALANFSLDNLGDASKLFMGLYQLDPTHVNCAVHHALCQFRLGHREAARSVLKDISHLARGIEEKLMLAQGYLTTGSWKPAVELFYEMMDAKPDNERVHQAYLMAMFRLSQDEETKVEEKYITRYLQVLEDFPDRFPGQKFLHKVEIKDNDYKKLFDILEEKSQRGEKVESLYRKGKIPLALITEVTGNRSLDVWNGFTSSELGIQMSSGAAEEAEFELALLQEHMGGAVVADIYPLLFLGHIGRLGLLPTVFGKVLVHHSVMDELLETVSNLEMSVKKGITSIAQVDGQRYMIDTSSEAVTASAQHLTLIIETIRDNPSFELRGFSKEKDLSKRIVANLLHASSRDSLLLAEELDVPLYCDDLILRQLIANEGRVDAFSTQYLIEFSLRSKLITEEDRHQLKRQLVDHNYRFVTINVPYILDQLKRAKHSLSEVGPIVAPLVVKGTTLASMAIVLCQLIIAMSHDSSLSEGRWIEVLRKILLEASANHDLKLLEEAMSSSFVYASNEQEVTIRGILRDLFSEAG